MGYTIRIGEQEIYWEDGKRKRSVYSADADEPLDFACGEQENCIDLTYKDFGKMVETIGGKFQERMSVGGIWLKDYPGYFKIRLLLFVFLNKRLPNIRPVRTNRPISKPSETNLVVISVSNLNLWSRATTGFPIGSAGLFIG